jgi:Fe-S-cluster containining protein
MECRLGCGACCIAPSISTPIPGMPNGKPANSRCIQLNSDNLCMLFGQPTRPKVCLAFSPDNDVCGSTNHQALDNLIYLEKIT